MLHDFYKESLKKMPSYNSLLRQIHATFCNITTTVIIRELVKALVNSGNLCSNNGALPQRASRYSHK